MLASERYQVIQQLKQKYPYPDSFWERKTDNQLLAMLYKNPKPRKENPQPTPVTTCKRKVVNGVAYVLTDSGRWEKEID